MSSDSHSSSSSSAAPIVPVETWTDLTHAMDAAKLPMPFVHEIFLLESKVAGTGYVKDIVSKTADLKPGCVLELLRNPANKYDSMAIRILNPNKERIGFVPRDDNPILARLMDAGKLIFAKVKSIDSKFDWVSISIDIFMRDL